MSYSATSSVSTRGHDDGIRSATMFHPGANAQVHTHAHTHTAHSSSAAAAPTHTQAHAHTRAHPRKRARRAGAAPAAAPQPSASRVQAEVTALIHDIMHNKPQIALTHTHTHTHTHTQAHTGPHTGTHTRVHALLGHTLVQQHTNVLFELLLDAITSAGSESARVRGIKLLDALFTHVGVFRAYVCAHTHALVHSLVAASSLAHTHDERGVERSAAAAERRCRGAVVLAMARQWATQFADEYPTVWLLPQTVMHAFGLTHGGERDNGSGTAAAPRSGATAPPQCEDPAGWKTVKTQIQAAEACGSLFQRAGDVLQEIDAALAAADGVEIDRGGRPMRRQWRYAFERTDDIEPGRLDDGDDGSVESDVFSDADVADASRLDHGDLRTQAQDEPAGRSVGSDDGEWEDVEASATRPSDVGTHAGAEFEHADLFNPEFLGDIEVSIALTPHQVAAALEESTNPPAPTQLDPAIVDVLRDSVTAAENRLLRQLAALRDAIRTLPENASDISTERAVLAVSAGADAISAVEAATLRRVWLPRVQYEYDLLHDAVFRCKLRGVFPHASRSRNAPGRGNVDGVPPIVDASGVGSPGVRLDLGGRPAAPDAKELAEAAQLRIAIAEASERAKIRAAGGKVPRRRATTGTSATDGSASAQTAAGKRARSSTPAARQRVAPAAANPVTRVKRDIASFNARQRAANIAGAGMRTT